MEWHHIAVVVDRETAQTITLYIDGKQAQDAKSIASITGSIDAGDWLLGAAAREDGTCFSGLDNAQIDSFGLYKTALSLEQIRQASGYGTCTLLMDSIGAHLPNVEIGERYTRKALDSMQSDFDRARQALSENPSQGYEIAQNLDASYQTFLEGTPARLSFHLLADLHTGAMNPNRLFDEGLEEINQINPDAKAIVFAGDLTDFGTLDELGNFYWRMQNHLSETIEGVFVALGNHDIRGSDYTIWEKYPQGINPYYPVYYEAFMKHNAPYMGDTGGRIYYDQWIDGYHFIVLNPENASSDYAWLSQEQLAWLDAKLSENESFDRPVFVTIHQPLNDTFVDIDDFEVFGQQDAQIKEILKKHPQTVLMSGHLHTPFGRAEIQDSSYGTLVDVPGFRYMYQSFEVYIYDTEIVFRAYDLWKHRWQPAYDVTIRLDTLPSLVAQSKSLRPEDYTAASWNALSSRIESLQQQAIEQMDLKAGSYTPERRREINALQTRFQRKRQIEPIW